MALIKNGKKVQLGTGYGPPSIPYAEYRNQQQQERAARITEREARITEREARTLEANARRGVSASNTAGPPAAPVSKAAAGRGRVSLDPERGDSPGGERSSRQYVSLPEPRKAETAPVDYRRAVELNRLNHDLNRLEAQRRQAAVDLDTDALNRVNRTMKDIRAARGQQTLGDRASDTLSTIFSGSGASYVNTLGTAQELAGAARRRYLPLEIEQKEKELARYLENARCAGDDAERQYWEYEAQRAREALAGYRAGIQESWTQGERLHTLADRMQDDSAKYRESARDGLGKFGSDVVDAGISFGQSLADNAIGAVTGTGMAPFVIRAFGGAAQDARRGGADLDRQLRYGTAQAAKEYITEKLFGLAVPQRLLGKAGTGSLDDAVERGIRNVTERLARTPAGRKALGGLLTWGAGGATESLEEGIGALIENTLINPNLRAWDPDTRTGQEKFEDGLHDMLVGGLSGLMGVPNLVSYHPNTAQSLSLSTLEDTGAQPGQTAPAAQTAPVQRDVLMEAAARGGRLEAETTGHQNTVPESGDPDMSLVERVRQFIPQMQNMGPVAEVTGTEIPAGGKIVDRLVNFINMIGGKVNRPGFGDVLFSRGRIKSSMLGHGVGPAKIDVFAAVPKVIQSGRQIDFQPNWKGRGYDTYTFMAPINYKGRNYLGVIVTKDAQSSRYYLHEVVDADGNVLFRNDENPASASDGTSALSGDLDTVANAGALNQSPSDGRVSHKGTFDTVETLSVGGTRPPVSDITQRSGTVKPQETDLLMQILFGDGTPAEPEVKTDALMQAILDAIKPAQALPAPDAAEQKLLRLYEVAQALPPQPGGDALMQALSGGGTTAPETAAESNTFIQGFQDDDGPGLPERDLRQADGPGDTPGLNAESDIADGIRRDIKSLWLGEKVIAFKDLPKEYKQQFRAALQQAPPEIKTLLRRYYPKADYIVQAGRHSYYDSGLAENVIALGTNAVPSTLAHELFHKIDRWNQISRTLKESLARDKATLETASRGQIKEYLMRRYPEAFTVKGFRKTSTMKIEYRGIADILNGLSEGKDHYGYGHKEGYWKQPGALETEAWAQFGRIQFQNDPDVMKMLQEVFPNFFEHAMIKLKELI